MKIVASFGTIKNENQEILGKVDFCVEKLQPTPTEILLPGVIFSMRYPDDAGYVWNTIALGKDKAGSYLINEAECFIAYPELSSNPTYLPEYVTPVKLDCYDMSKYGKEALSTFIKRHRVKVIVFMSALPSTIDLEFFRKMDVYTLNTENDSFNHQQSDSLARKSIKFFIRKVLKRQLHDLHLANAKSQKTFLSRFAQIPDSRLVLLTDGIDCDRFKPGDKCVARAQTGMAADTFWVLSVAQARPEKRLDYIIRAAKHVTEARPCVKVGFMHVGDSDGPLFFKLKSLVVELGIEQVFHFAGRQDNLVPYYRAASIMVHAAERESFGLAVVEGMACGLPVIASAAAGPKETIVHEETGAVIDIDDFDGFVSKILLYIDNKELMGKHGTKARERASTHFSIERYGKELAQHVVRFL